MLLKAKCYHSVLVWELLQVTLSLWVSLKMEDLILEEAGEFGMDDRFSAPTLEWYNLLGHGWVKAVPATPRLQLSKYPERINQSTQSLCPRGILPAKLRVGRIMIPYIIFSPLSMKLFSEILEVEIQKSGQSQKDGTEWLSIPCVCKWLKGNGDGAKTPGVCQSINTIHHREAWLSW